MLLMSSASPSIPDSAIFPSLVRRRCHHPVFPLVPLPPPPPLASHSSRWRTATFSSQPTQHCCCWGWASLPGSFSMYGCAQGSDAVGQPKTQRKHRLSAGPKQESNLTLFWMDRGFSGFWLAEVRPAGLLLFSSSGCFCALMSSRPFCQRQDECGRFDLW